MFPTRFTTFIALVTLAGYASAWQILNYDNGACSGTPSILTGSGDSGCLEIDPGTFGLKFDDQVSRARAYRY